jgi:uncharacterized protein with FMN-binding domain
MKKAPIILLCTVAGLVGALSFHSSPATISLGTVPAAPTTVTPPSTTPPTTRPSTPKTTTTTLGHNPPPTTTPTTRPSTPTTTTRPAPTTTTTAPPPTTTVTPSSRQATGVGVNYIFGILSVQVSVTKSTITKVSIASINDGGNPRSVSIDQYAIPILEREAMQAQSGTIQSVSGASYTSAGFTQSLQSALSQLGL